MKIKAQCFLRKNGKVTQHSDIFDLASIYGDENKELLWAWDSMLCEEDGDLTSYISGGTDREPIWSCLEKGNNSLGLKFIE